MDINKQIILLQFNHCKKISAFCRELMNCNNKSLLMLQVIENYYYNNKVELLEIAKKLGDEFYNELISEIEELEQ